MIARYTRPEMGRIFGDEHRFATWLRVEVAHLETLEECGIAPAGTADRVRERARVRPERIAELEETLQHDVIAFLTSVSEELGEEKGWLHFGMTSSDLVDTAQALILLEAADQIRTAWAALGSSLRAIAVRNRDLLMVGRTHGIHAEPITFGFKVLGWFAEAQRQAERLEGAAAGIGSGKLSGAVGTAVHLAPSVEERVMARLGLSAEPVATQVVPRDRHAHFLSVLAGLGSSCERIAVEIRHLQRTEVRELEEPFGKGQKGSSAMPHKRNPVICERISGLARLLRGYAGVGLENIPLWHERDISHSSAERVVLGDACIVLDYMIDRLSAVLSDLTIDAGAMARNLESTGGLIYSQRVLLALTEALGDREAAYRIVQGHAMETWKSGGSFRDRIAADPMVRTRVRAEELERLFDPSVFTRNLPAIFDRVLASSWGRA